MQLRPRSFLALSIGLLAVIAVLLFAFYIDHYWGWLTRDASGFFTAFLVVVGSIQAGLFIWQLILLRKATEDAANAANAAKDSALAAIEANKINRENLLSSRRAWLSLESAILKGKTEFSEQRILFDITVTIKNIGQTPAINIWGKLEAYFIIENDNAEKYVDFENRFKASLRLRPPIGQVLFPNEFLTQDQILVYGPEKINTRPDGTRKVDVLILIGIAYKITGDENFHITYFTHAIMNVPIGSQIPPGFELPRQPFHAGEVD